MPRDRIIGQWRGHCPKSPPGRLGCNRAPLMPRSSAPAACWPVLRDRAKACHSVTGPRALLYLFISPFSYPLCEVDRVQVILPKRRIKIGRLCDLPRALGPSHPPGPGCAAWDTTWLEDAPSGTDIPWSPLLIMPVTVGPTSPWPAGEGISPSASEGRVRSSHSGWLCHWH